jgi:hypothetical protein
VAKPWGRYEIGYINHPKFRALNPNAICLWWECKNYCDEFHTDGIVPATVVRGFRFYSRKAMDLLVRSCGLKPNREPYAPLWEALDVGGMPHLRMHDYLDHNDCRDAVLARIEKADQRKEADRERKAAARAAKEALVKGACHVRADKPADTGADNHADTTADSPRIPQNVRVYTETPTETKEARTTTTRPLRSSAIGPLAEYPRLRVFRWMVDRLMAALGSAPFQLDDWLLRLERDSTLVIPTTDKDRWEWLQHAFDYELRQRGLLRAATPDPDAELRALTAKGPSVRPYEKTPK